MAQSSSLEQNIRSFLHAATPSLSTLILLGPLLLIYGIVSGWFVGMLKSRYLLETAYSRKIFHVLIFTMAGVLQLTIGVSAVMLFGALISGCVMYAVFRGEGFPFYEAMARKKDAPHRTMYILIPLITTALGGLFSNIFFGKIAAVGYIVSGWGDAVGEPVGATWGNHPYRVPSIAGVPAIRTLEGSGAVLFFGILGAFFVLLGMGYSWGYAIFIAGIAGCVGALVEAISNHGLDNFTVQIFASLTAYLLVTYLI